MKSDRSRLFFEGKLQPLLFAVIALGVSAKSAVAFAPPTAPRLDAIAATPNSHTSTSQTSQATSGESLLEQGRTLYQGGQYAEAARVWQQATEVFADNPLERALALNYLSLAYQQMGAWEEAKGAIETSLSLLESTPNSEAATYGSIFAIALNTDGHWQLARGEGEKALERWQQAAIAYSEAGDELGAMGARINQAQALQSLGFYARATETLEAVKASLLAAPDSSLKATGLRSLGNALRAIGDLDASREVLQQSLQVARSLESPDAIAATQFSLGNTAVAIAKGNSTATSEIEAALEAYQQASTLATSPIVQIEAQLNQLGLLVETEKWEDARTLVAAIEGRLDRLPRSRRSIYARVNFARNLEELPENRFETAATILATAIEEAQQLEDVRSQSMALGRLGELYERTGQSEIALDLTEKALLKAQAVQASDIAYQWQWQLGRLLNAQGKTQQATAAYEVAISTLQSLRNDLAAIEAGNSDVQYGFRQSVEPVYRQFVELLLDSNGGNPSQENLLKARKAIESLQLAELDNFFREACLDTEPVAVDEIDPEAASIYPIILGDRIDVIVSLPDSTLRHYSQRVAPGELDRTLLQLRQGLGRISANQGQVRELSQQVYDWVLRPIDTELQQQGIKTLVFVLDGRLRNIPMAALYDGERYAIEKYGIALTPGLQLIASKPLESEKLATLAAGLSEARQGFTPLPGVEPELTQIQAQIPSEVLLNESFTREALQAQMEKSDFPIVHIATHGQFSSQADLTFILTWDGVINVKDLDTLLKRRSARSSQPIELLVFSACETADGDDRAALGLAGVAVRAGARSTMATLWQVNDRSSAALMEAFYQEITQPGATKAEALRRAQLSVLQDNRYRIPYFWAPYVLVGNWL
ncbi:MAG: CHAT domain-containing protein [Cyanobacteriota bacterium]|nr:CHAT domain-containing protein [Cyanobacteriota bacterium]